ncbi:hypothetical protein AB9F42_33965, partial [Rhizobium leguminosarum]
RRGAQRPSAPDRHCCCAGAAGRRYRKYRGRAFPDRTFPAEIEQIRFASEVVNNVVTYNAVLSVDNADLLLRPGMKATADVTVEAVKDNLMVPNAALR